MPNHFHLMVQVNKVSIETLAGGKDENTDQSERHQRTRAKMASMLEKGKLDDRDIEIKIEDNIY